MNKSFNHLIESILEAGYKGPASLKEETDWDDPTERYWDRSPIEVTPQNLKGYEDSRQIKKDKIIKRKEETIGRNKELLSDWLNRMSLRDDINTIIIQKEKIKYEKKIYSKIQELERIKKLPLTDPLFN